MRILIIFLLLCSNAFAQTDMRIVDRTTSGYKVNVNKLGTLYGVGTDSIPATTVLNGQKTVTTAGTRVQVSSSSVPVRSVCIKALHADTGKIYVGNSTVSSANGYELIADLSVCLDVNDVSLVYIDSSVNGEGVSYAAVY